jgi:hypothetical protein
VPQRWNFELKYDLGHIPVERKGVLYKDAVRDKTPEKKPPNSTNRLLKDGNDGNAWKDVKFHCPKREYQEPSQQTCQSREGCDVVFSSSPLNPIFHTSTIDSSRFDTARYLLHVKLPCTSCGRFFPSSRTCLLKTR